MNSYNTNVKFKNNYGTINNVNLNRIKKLKKYNIKKMVSILLVTLTVVGGVSHLISAKENKSISNQVDKESVATFNVPIMVQKGDTIDEFADLYYGDNASIIYSSKQDYMDEIRKINGLKYSGIDANELIMVPIVIDKDSEDYKKIQEINNKIDDITKNNLWIEYTVKYGDNLSSLAAKASGSQEETLEISRSISSKNNIKGYLQAGDIIYILNPELGPLKVELNDILSGLSNSYHKDGVKHM